MREMTAEKAASQISQAYRTYAAQYDRTWMPVREIADRVDLTLDEIRTGVLHLMSTDRGFIVIPESNQKTLTAEDRANRLWIGNQHKDLIGWS